MQRRVHRCHQRHPRRRRHPTRRQALLAEAATKSGLLWVDVPGDRAWPAWHVWVDGTAYVVSGPGEQALPELPESVVLVLRSKDTGGRLLRVAARAERLRPEDARWEPATTALKAARLNAPAGDVVGRWAAEATVTALVPQLPLLEGPGGYDDASGAAAPAATPATTPHLAPVAPARPSAPPSGHPLSRDAAVGAAG